MTIERTEASQEGSVLRPHVIAWNLTRRCNLACSHCYISAGPWHTEEGELSTERCLQVVDQIIVENPNPMIILSGGEPLARTDLEEIAAYATGKGATCVVGTNGTGLTAARIASIKDAGVTGVAVSIDSLRPLYHNRFRHGDSALDETTSAVDRLGEAELDFIIQTTVTRGNRGELADIADWANKRGAVSFNVYFLVQTGRGQKMPGLSVDENEEVLNDILRLEQKYRGRMLVRSKCQPALMRLVYAKDPESPLARYETRCPCGVQYCRITPDGKVTPCPYLPVVAGDLAKDTFGEIWNGSPVFARIRGGELDGKCGRCAYREVCGGCRARAYADEGDVMASDLSCGYQPQGREPAIARRTTLTYGSAAKEDLEWTADARGRVVKIPSFVRSVVMQRIERYAKGRGHAVVTAELIDEVRQNMPVDFSKRLPFFLRRKS